MENVKSGKPRLCSQVIKEFGEHERGLREVFNMLRRIAEGEGRNETHIIRLNEAEKHFLTFREEMSAIINAFCSHTTVDKPEHFHGPPVIIRCKQWEDFKLQAVNAVAVSFLYKAEERAFQVDALKEGRVYTFSGSLPHDVLLLKSWLAKELDVAESKVMEGILGIG